MERGYEAIASDQWPLEAIALSSICEDKASGHDTFLVGYSLELSW